MKRIVIFMAVMLLAGNLFSQISPELKVHITSVEQTHRMDGCQPTEQCGRTILTIKGHADVGNASIAYVLRCAAWDRLGPCAKVRAGEDYNMTLYHAGSTHFYDLHDQSYLGWATIKSEKETSHRD